MAIKKIIFDVGQVLVKFNPKNLFLKILQDEEEVNFFLKNVCTWDWHIQQDLVYDTSKAAKPMVEKFPKYQEAIEAFYDRFLEMIPIIYQDNVNLALRLKKMGYSIYLLSKKQKDKTMLWILDRVVIVVALAAVLIRLGNLFNSEIIGTATDVPWAFIFARVDDVPRHPAQLYESIFYLISFLIL